MEAALRIVDDPWSPDDASMLECCMSSLVPQMESVLREQACVVSECSTLCPVFMEVASQVAVAVRSQSSASSGSSGSSGLVFLVAYANRLLIVTDAPTYRVRALAHAPSFLVESATYERLLHDVCMFTTSRAEKLHAMALHLFFTNVDPLSTLRGSAGILGKRVVLQPFAQAGVEALSFPSVPAVSLYTRVHPVFECIVSPANMIAVVEAGGMVLRFVHVHAVYRGSYLRLTSERADTSAFEAMLLQPPPLRPGFSLAPAAACFPSSPCAATAPPLATSELILSSLAPPSLYEECRAALVELATAVDVFALIDHPPERMHALAVVVFKRRGRDIQQRLLPQHELAARVATDAGTLQELSGLVFDVVLQQCSLAEVPPEWNPNLFFTLPDIGFLTVLYMLQWRNSVERFIEMAKLAAMDNTAAIIAQLDTFRVGILWQGRHAPLTQSLHRQLQCGTHLFAFNAGRDAFSVKPGSTHNMADFLVVGALQTQSAKQRDTVTSFFLSQALHLVSGVLAGGMNTERHAHVMSLLLGIYMSNLHAYDLRHDYRNNQATARDLRQLLPVSRRRR